MIRENPSYTILPLDYRNQESAQIPGFCNPMVKWCNWDFLWSKIEPHTGLGLWPPGYTFYSRSCASTYWFWLAQVGWLFSGWTVSIWRHGNWTRGSRFLIRENPSCTILPLDYRNQESECVLSLPLVFSIHNKQQYCDILSDTPIYTFPLSLTISVMINNNRFFFS